MWKLFICFANGRALKVPPGATGTQSNSSKLLSVHTVTRQKSARANGCPETIHRSKTFIIAIKCLKLKSRRSRAQVLEPGSPQEGQSSTDGTWNLTRPRLFTHRLKIHQGLVRREKEHGVIKTVNEVPGTLWHRVCRYHPSKLSTSFIIYPFSVVFL